MNTKDNSRSKESKIKLKEAILKILDSGKTIQEVTVLEVCKEAITEAVDESICKLLILLNTLLLDIAIKKSNEIVEVLENSCLCSFWKWISILILNLVKILLCDWSPG